jgi:hypothetical protein
MASEEGRAASGISVRKVRFRVVTGASLSGEFLNSYVPEAQLAGYCQVGTIPDGRQAGIDRVANLSWGQNRRSTH